MKNVLYIVAAIVVGIVLAAVPGLPTLIVLVGLMLTVATKTTNGLRKAMAKN